MSLVLILAMAWFAVVAMCVAVLRAAASGDDAVTRALPIAPRSHRAKRVRMPRIRLYRSSRCGATGRECTSIGTDASGARFRGPTTTGGRDP